MIIQLLISWPFGTKGVPVHGGKIADDEISSQAAISTKHSGSSFTKNL